jgi:hypothetical protein
MIVKVLISIFGMNPKFLVNVFWKYDVYGVWESTIFFSPYAHSLCYVVFMLTARTL